MNIKIRGEYRDIVTRNKEIIEDRGWKSNKISGDLGTFIAVMMRNRSFSGNGINYMAVGSSSTAGSDSGEAAFKTRVKEKVFKISNIKNPEFYSSNNEWAWVKPISEISFLDQNPPTVITNKLKIEVTFEKDEKDLLGKTLEFKEFALLGTGTYDSSPHIFFINYVVHEPISITFQKSSEDNGTELTRTAQLTFL